LGILEEAQRETLGKEEKVDSAQTTLIAHELLLRMLVSSEKNRNPAFAAEAQKSADEFLGHLPLDQTTECFVQARSKFMAALDTRTDLFVGPKTPGPMSLRRRFLLWLLRG
jgi:hypothetical protein